ncbi:MAG TPA: MerR family transcriptional regulator [Syntrophomonadaceae bacterium]|nr:MerR family transcriptional regulator [Syntrophomonadaceae bacterium]
MNERFYKIGEVSEILKVEQHTLRYLENSLKLRIKRDERGDRLYAESDLDTFRLIIQLKDKGLNTTAIKMALDNVEQNEETGITPIRESSLNVELLEVLSVVHRIVEQNDQMLNNNQALVEKVKSLEEKVDRRNLEREKKVDEFLTLWKNEQEGKNKTWFSRLVGK